MVKRLTLEKRRLVKEMVKRVGNKSFVARALGISRDAVYRWVGRDSFEDKPRNKRESKITLRVEQGILALRNTFRMGCAFIKQHLFHAPKYLRDSLGGIVQGVVLSREIINQVLKAHKLNGYFKKKKGWNFFRAKKPNVLWQLDPKGPVTFNGKKHWFVACIDDNSRYLLMLKHYDHAPSCEDIQKDLLPLIKKHQPKNILTDNNPFKQDWDNWLKKNSVKSLHAHPYYPQDKGKIERAIRTISQEFIYHIKKFPEWTNNLNKYKHWYNQKRFHHGIQAFPKNIYTK